MTIRNSRLSALVAALFVFSVLVGNGTFAWAADSAQGTKLEASLAGVGDEAAASGRAKFEVRPDRARLSVEVEDVANAAAVEFVVGGSSLGSLAIVGGGADLNLDIRDGDTVPLVGPGTLVEVIDVASGAVILIGAF